MKPKKPPAKPYENPALGPKKKHHKKASHVRYKADAPLRMTEMARNASPKARASRST
jgi:hypothetical protein